LPSIKEKGAPADDDDAPRPMMTMPEETHHARGRAALIPLGAIGLDPHFFGTHSLRRTKATLIYRRTGNLRAVQLLLGHTKIESTVRYLGIEVDDALAIAEQVDV
jgi:integrase